MYMHVVIAETLDATVLIPEMIAKYFWQTEFTVQLGVYSLRDFNIVPHFVCSDSCFVEILSRSVSSIISV